MNILVYRNSQENVQRLYTDKFIIISIHTYAAYDVHRSTCLTQLINELVNKLDQVLKMFPTGIYTPQT